MPLARRLAKQDREDGGDEQGVEVARDADLAGDEQLADQREDLADDASDGEQRRRSCRAAQEASRTVALVE